MSTSDEKTSITPITSVLVANRGEIARRVFRTCRDLGISTVAVHSDADAGSLHMSEADAAVRLPGNAPADTYLRAGLVIEAARRAGADAIHPGYGFLSENAAFAAEVEAAGLVWIGPPVAAIESMGSKIESKRLMAEAGVPVLTELDPAAITAGDLPVLVKASAGGGGRGMRVVRELADLQREVELAAVEAGSAFGDPTVFCEPYLATGRHIEVQVLADRHGTVWAVGERECSIQRRHQKIVEEAPSPLVERIPGMRRELFAAAVAAARAVDYVGAGTVEFLADDDGRFFFLEMNTRLQVEHPVTECTTGLDLVALQIQVASGATLPHPEPPASSGHSIEVRLYAEDPASGWQPQSGRLHRLEVPDVDVEFAVMPGGAASPGIRLDSGVGDGADVGIHYDPMLAKVISFAPDRHAAARRLAAALRRSRIHGLITNRDLLVRILQHPAFLAGETDTAFFDRHGLHGSAGQQGLADPLVDPDHRPVVVLAAALAQAAANRSEARVLGGLPSGWRNVWSQTQTKRYRVVGDGEELTASYALTRDGLVVGDGFDARLQQLAGVAPEDGTSEGEAADASGGNEAQASIELIAAGPDEVVLVVDGVRSTFAVARYRSSTDPGGLPALVVVDGPHGSLGLEPVSRFPDPDDHVAPGSLLAPMPGSVIRVAVAQGDRVEEGQVLLWLEAMKMQHEVRAPMAGVVADLPAHEGRQVEVGEVLAVVTADDQQVQQEQHQLRDEHEQDQK